MMNHLPGIRRACLDMAQANGCVNRIEPTSVWLERAHTMLTTLHGPLQPIDRWLNNLSDDDMRTVIDGEHSEMERVLKGAPVGTDALLNAWAIVLGLG